MTVSPIPVDAVKQQIAVQNVGVPQSYAWSAQALAEACRNRGIEYEESVAFSSLRGVVVRCGKTIIMSVRASLEEREKIFTIGHELAHLALNYMPSDPIIYLKDTQSTPHILQDSQKEMEADVWAAHLLVFPEVYEQALEEAGARYPTEQAQQVQKEAIIYTANRLNIPVQVVDLWLRHRDWPFSEAPQVWFAWANRRLDVGQEKLARGAPL
ncbi:MAG TPA: ImmA/IrrE family metallo-endopeptidase [Ktedonobacterales bacterium]|jgi:hypothetical protein